MQEEEVVVLRLATYVSIIALVIAIGAMVVNFLVAGPEGPQGPQGPTGKNGTSVTVEDVLPVIEKAVAAEVTKQLSEVSRPAEAPKPAPPKKSIWE